MSTSIDLASLFYNACYNPQRSMASGKRVLPCKTSVQDLKQTYLYSMYPLLSGNDFTNEVLSVTVLLFREYEHNENIVDITIVITVA